MRAHYFAISLIAVAALSCAAAGEKYAFGPVPPPSVFSTNVPPALREADDNFTNSQPDRMPEAVTNSVMPLQPAAPAAPGKAKSKSKARPKPAPEVPPPAVDVFPQGETLPPPAPLAVTNLIISAGSQYYGAVAAVDPEMRFVVLNYSLGWLPGHGQTLTVYRHGIRVGTVKISGPQRDDNVTADITDGELKVGDEARVN